MDQEKKATSMPELELEEMEKKPVVIHSPPHTPRKTQDFGQADPAEKERLTNGDEKKDEKKEEKKEMTSFSAMLRYATPLDKLFMLIGTLGAIVAGAGLPAFSIVFGNILNEFNGDPANILNRITFYSYVFLIIGGAMFVGAYAALGLFMYTSERQTKRIREAFLESILRQDIGWFDSHTPGELNTRLAEDTKNVGRALGEKFATCFQHSTTFIAGLVIGFVKGWQLALLVLGITPVIGVCGAVMAKALGSYSNQNQAAYADAGSVADEVFSSIRTVQAFSGEPKESLRYGSHLGKARIAGVKKAVFQGASLGVTNFVIFSAYGLSFWFGTWLIQNGHKNNWTGKTWTGGDVMNVFFAVLLGAFSLGSLNPCFEAFATGRAACWRLFEIIDRKVPIDALSKEGKKPAEIRGDIEFKDIHFRYPTRKDYPIFTGFNLSVKQGQSVALVGESGSGKSTVVGLIERFYDPEKGTVLVDGVDLKELNIEWWRNHVAIVSQEPTLFEGSIADNIRFGKPDATDQEVEQAARDANAHDFIKALPEKYRTMVGQEGALVSGGQKQRIAIARAILKNPVVLLLDEATSALDNESERLVQNALEKVMKGRTTIIIAHRLTTIQNADVIHVVHRGKIMESGTHRELMSRGEMYYGLVQAQEMHEKEGGGGGGGEVEVKGELDEKSAGTRLVRAPSESQHLIRRQSSLSMTTKPLTKEEAKKKKEEEEREKEPVLPVAAGRIFGIAAPNWHWFVVGVVGAAVAGVAMPIWSIIFGEITAVMFETDSSKQSDKAGFWAGMFVLIGACLGAGNICQELGFGIVGERLTETIRQRTFDSVLRNEIGWFDEKSHAARILTTRLSVDASLVQEGTTKRVGQMMFALATLVGGLVISFTKSPKLAAVTLATLPVLIFSSALQFKFIAGFSKDEQKAYERAGSTAGEAFANIRTVHSFNGVQRVLNTYSFHLEKPLRIGGKTANASGLGFGFSQFLIFGIHALCWWYGAKLIDQGELTFANMLSAVFALVMCGFGLGQAAQMIPNLQQADFAKNNVFHLIDRKPKIDASSAEGAKAQVKGGEVELKDVHFAYPERPDRTILNGLTLHIRAGETVAFVGPSGCGKSTVMGLLLRFYDPEKGTITIDGVETKSVNVTSLRRQIGIVSQEPRLFDATIKENILYGKPDATDEEIEAACKAANIWDWIQRQPDKLATQCGVKGGKLSGGQKQRIAIARALVRKPVILLLDEATSALDSESEKVVQQALDELIETKSRTTLVIAHRLSTIQKSDRIFVFDHGRVMEEGTHESLLAKDGMYTNLVRAGGGKRDQLSSSS